MRKVRMAIVALVTVLLGVLAGLWYVFYQQGTDVLASAGKQSVAAEWGYSVSEDGRLYRPWVSLNGYTDLETKRSNGEGRKKWAVEVYPDTSYELGYLAEGVSDEDIDDVALVIGSEHGDRSFTISWQRSEKDETVYVNFGTTLVPLHQMIYRDLNGDGKWDIEDYKRYDDGKYVMDGRTALVDDQYFFVIDWKDRFARTCTIRERDGSTSVVSLVDGKWERTGINHEPGK